jgi:predicted CxxxxCH...CXXCH cytochrome family protein
MLALCACGVLRPTDFAPVCPDYDTAVQPILTARCGTCHGADSATGYSVADYRSVLRPSDLDVLRVAPGDTASLVLQAARGELPGHAAIATDELTLLTHWIVPCRGNHGVTQYHPAGWADPLNGADFHGAAARDGGYLFTDCKTCHGDDLRGGKAQVDCHSCHAQTDGPLACNTCHGDLTSPAPPRALNGSYARATLGVGAHRQHVLDGPLHKGFDCVSCHPHVQHAEDDGHYRFGGQFLAQGPVVTLAASDAGTPPSWDRNAATCSQSACHAPNPNDTSATNMTPVWTRTTGEDGKCGSCHGLGPKGHASTHCEACHAPGYADGGVDLALHLNGRLDFTAGDDCNACHAGPSKGAAFYDTHGSTDETVPTVGAHAAHFETELRGPLTCDDCHAVPKNAQDGHVNLEPVPVFAGGWDGGLAASDGVAPQFDAAQLTCNVYCHGSGQLLASRDHTPGLIKAPKWTGGESQDACGGACHGAPPQDGNIGHTIATSLDTCVMCHALTVNPDGGIRTLALPDGGVGSFHINGEINGNL